MKYRTLEEINESDLPDHIEFPQEYFPKGVGPGGFSPKAMYMFALRANSSDMFHDDTIKSWLILWLLDHIDWNKVYEEIYSKTDLEKAAEEIIPMSKEHIGPGETGTFAAKMIQPEDDPRYEGGTILGRNAGWE